MERELVTAATARDLMTRAPWRSSPLPPPPNPSPTKGAASKPEPQEPLRDVAFRRDRLLTWLRLNPWIPVDELARISGVHVDDAHKDLDQLHRLQVVVHEDDPPRWALKGTARMPRKPYGPRAKLSASALEVLELVRRQPWLTASEYWKLRGRGARHLAYVNLNTLTRGGHARMVIHEGVKRWGPIDATPPAGHSELRAGARSPSRRSMRPRLVALLAERPWLMTVEIAETLRSSRKGVDNALRDLLGEGKVRRYDAPAEMVAPGTALIYALADAPDPTPMALASVRDRTRERLPATYGALQQRVLTLLASHPWSDTQTITTRLGAFGRAKSGPSQAAVASALTTLRRKGFIVRVADDRYKYALPEQEPPKGISGVIVRSRNVLAPDSSPSPDRTIARMHAQARLLREAGYEVHLSILSPAQLAIVAPGGTRSVSS